MIDSSKWKKANLDGLHEYPPTYGELRAVVCLCCSARGTPPACFTRGGQHAMVQRPPRVLSPRMQPNRVRDPGDFGRAHQGPVPENLATMVRDGPLRGTDRGDEPPGRPPAVGSQPPIDRRFRASPSTLHGGF